MPKYVLKHGNLHVSKDDVSGGLLSPSADPKKPTVVELSEAEAKKVGGAGELQLLAEYEAELAGADAGAAAKAKALKDAAEKDAAEAAAKAKALAAKAGK